MDINSLHSLLMSIPYGHESHRINCPDHVIEEYMSHPTLVKQVHVRSFAAAAIGNKYLLRSSNYDKILDWLHGGNYVINHDTILFIIDKIKSSMVYTHTTLCILVKLLSNVYRIHIALSEQIWSLIEICVMSIDNFNLLEVLSTKCSGGGIGRSSCKCNGINSLLNTFHNYDYKIKITELFLTYTTKPITKHVIECMKLHKFIVLEPERFLS